MPARVIAITGGIGAGKSVLSRMLRCLGYDVLDCDSEAKRLMDSDASIKQRIALEVDAAAILPDGSIDRARLASTVFADAAALGRLNAIVHGAVRRRITEWRINIEADVAFVETAILYQSSLNREVDAEWRVVAPAELRVERVMLRNGLSREAVLQRLASQRYEPAPGEPRPPLTEFVNDNRTPLLPQLLRCLEIN